jgi:hypothetical protein
MGAPGNDRVIEALEHMLNRARAGQIGYVIAVMVDQNEKAMGGWSGTYSLQGACMKALEQMAGRMDAEILNKTLPERDPAVPANCVVYNMPCSPMSYDFLNWLIDAELNRCIKGAPSPLRVCFWFGRDGNTGFVNAAQQQMFERVMKPALDLIGAVADRDAADGHVKTIFTLRDVVDAHRRGFEVPKFRTLTHKPWASKRFGARPPITITLREMDLYPYRNSNMDAWLKLAYYLESRGERVVFVRDTAKAHHPMGQSFESCPEASIDLHYRMALYEIAKLNLFVSNGPATLGLFSDFPWMMFVRIEPDGHEYAPNTPSFWRDNFGISVGEQFPWSKAHQRIIWQPDDYENLIKAWEEFKALPAAAAAAE